MELTALILGLAGSLHCAFMCSPLAMAATAGNQKSFARKALYNLGRIFTYGIFGALATMFGAVINLSGFHLVFTIGVGLTLILMGLAGMTTIHIPFLTRSLMHFAGWIKNLFRKFLQYKTLSSLFILGMLNGLLPCGMTYVALTYCLTLAGPIDGFNFMILFGAGTLPVMLGVTAGLSVVLNKYRFNATRLMRYGFILLGVLVLVRLFLTPSHSLDHHLGAGGILFCQ